MTCLDLAAFRAAPLNREPFDYLILPRFILPEAQAALNDAYPKLEQGGSFPVESVTYGPAFQQLLDELRGPEFRQAFEEKFGLDLTDRPTTVTVRGRCTPKDGRIHTDSASKIITVLIYMNPAWEQSGGRLRLLRSGDDLEDVVAEVPPIEGTLLAFRRANNSWHGHKPFVGERRVIQFNWVTDKSSQKLVDIRHRLSALVKRMLHPGKARESQTMEM